jgi:hypothetical protein
MFVTDTEFVICGTVRAGVWGLTGGLMAEYRVYRLDGSGQISRAEWIEADDDDTAVRKARELKDSCVTCEIWQRERLVASFREDDTAE